MPDKVVTCRKCGERFIAASDKEGVEWYRRSQNYYYHQKCWQEFTEKYKEKTDSEWADLIFDLITRELNSSYNYFKIMAQIKNMNTKGKTNKGIYFSAYYYFIVQKHPYDEKYGLGIIPFIYDEATNYWIEAEEKKKGILAEIEKINSIEAEKGRVIRVQRQRKKATIEEPD